MTPEEYMHLMSRERSGEILLGIEPVAARRLFTDLSNALARELFGESLPRQRFTVCSFWVLSFVSILASIGAAIWAFGW